MITSKELRKKYIEFFKHKGHVEIPSASLVPENDPTVLFTTAGMHPLVPYLLGEIHPAGKRLVNVQKCVRTVDIEDVGDSTHNTFFEMLGNWSLGDYFKNESIRWSWEFLTDKKWLGVDPKRIKVTVFEGNEDAPRDEESIKIWLECYKRLSINAEVYDKTKGNAEQAIIFPLPKKDNWWGPAGITGPCGPDTEIFIDLGKPANIAKRLREKECLPGCKCGRYVEIWNNVFMQYNKTAEGKFVPLKQKNVDTGMGMERTLTILNGFSNVYETDVLLPIIQKIGEISNKLYSEHEKEFRIIADHIRASVFMINDGVASSNIERGYILRRLLRRAIRYGKMIGIKDKYLIEIAKIIIAIYKDFYKELVKNENKIFKELEEEEKKFFVVLEKVEWRRNKALYVIKRAKRKDNTDKTDEKWIKYYSQISKINLIDGWKSLHEFNENEKEIFVNEKLLPAIAFTLETTHGYPHSMFFEDDLKMKLYLSADIINKANNFYLLLFKNHQVLSRTASAGKFKGGLADHGEQTTKYHTATHLLLAALRKVLGEHIYQRGSNITAERLRFDFSHPEKLTNEQIQKVEDIVNEQIQKNLPVTFTEMTLEDAKRLGAMGIFETKYGEKVKVYTIGDEKTGVFSREICGGPHVERTGVLGKFKIKKEEASSAGVRRIRAVLE